MRDSGFEPIAFALSGRTLSAELDRGLREYAKWQVKAPATAGVGILPFGEKNDAWESGLLPELLTPKFQITANALVFAPLIMGVALLTWSFKKKCQDVPAAPQFSLKTLMFLVLLVAVTLASMKLLILPD